MKQFSAGKYVSQGYYSAFEPEYINREWHIDDNELIRLLGEAERAIGQLDMYSGYIPDIKLFIRMHVVKEATKSSKIEGTQTNIEEVLQNRDDLPEQKRNDWDEVQNYIKSLDFALDDMSIPPFSGRLIKDIHRVLLQGVRGAHKLPGEFRTSQNWIGGASISDAVFIPPPSNMVPEYISDIEKFAHNDGLHLPELIKIAIIHYQFETVHPFLDGNGRVGRLLIPIYLVSKGLLKVPVLYISDFFERNRQLYYDNLMKVRTSDDIMQWIKFFLVGIKETSENGIKTFDAILKLSREVESKLNSLKSKASKAHLIINHLYSFPYIDAAGVREITKLTPASVYQLIKSLENIGILTEITGGKRDKQYVFNEYLNIFLQ